MVAFVKAHLVSLSAGVVGLLCLVIALLGMMSDAVEEKMSERVRAASKIDTLKRNPQNDRTIAAEKNAQARFSQAYSAALEVAEDFNTRQPLVATAFPAPATMTTPFEFVDRYKLATSRLAADLDAGTPPTPEEVEEERTNIQERLALENDDGDGDSGELSGGDRRGRQATRRPTVGMSSAAGPPGAMAPGMGSMSMGRGMGSGPPMGRQGGAQTFQPRRTVDRDQLRFDPEFVAAINKARSIRMYVDSGAFHVTDIVSAVQAPDVTQLWYAQMSLWIQQDIVDAIAKLNEAAAARVQTEAYVEHVPVKRIEAVRVFGYELDSGLMPFPPAVGPEGGRGGPDMPPPSESFTGNVSDDDFDVIAFGMVLWVDQRDLLQVIDAICGENLYQCVDVDYQLATSENTPAGYVFGTAPVVRAELQFEGFFAKQAFKDVMPPTIADLISGEAGRER